MCHLNLHSESMTEGKVSKLQELVAHEIKVNCVALGHNSVRVMATGGDDKKVNLWAIGKPNCIISLKGHGAPVDCVKFGRIEEVVCAGTSSGALKMWDLEAIKISKTLTGHKSSIKCMDFHPFGEYMSSGSVDTNVKLWDNRRKGCIYTYKGHCSTVNSLKFSPDGKWLVSGCDGGIVKLWDLQAGKLLAEFGDHCGAIYDVKFHPSDFILASASGDGTVKFWDLENFQLISSSDGIAGQMKCIEFNPDGECLFSGAQDLLKLYGWEPFCTYDSVLTSWHNVEDMCTSQNHLIVGSCHGASVCVHMIDLANVHPFKKTCSCSGEEHTFYSVTKRNSSRKSFTKVTKDSQIDVKMEKGSSDSSNDFETCSISSEEAEGRVNYKEASTSLISPKYTDVLNLDQSVKPKTEKNTTEKVELNQERSECINLKTKNISDLSERITILKLNSETLSAPFENSEQENTPKCVTCKKVIKNASLTKIQEAEKPLILSNIYETGEKNSNKNWKSDFVPETTAVVKPITIVSPTKDILLENETTFTDNFKKINNFHVLWNSDKEHYIKDLGLLDFMPRNIQENNQTSHPIKSRSSDARAICLISQDHESLMTILRNRKKNLLNVLQLWKDKNIKEAIEYTVKNTEQATLVDIVKIIILRPQLWTLSICQILLPQIYQIITSKYEEYRKVGCLALKVILDHFLPLIRDNMVSPPCIGVDLSREERREKCMSCYHYLICIQRFLMQNDKLLGVPPELFNEVRESIKAIE